MNDSELIGTIRTLFNLLTPKGKDKIKSEINRNKSKTHDELYREIKARIDKKYPTKPKKAPSKLRA